MEPIIMVDECVDAYRVDDLKNGGAVITIRVPQRFRELWVAKLSELATDEPEINYYTSKPDTDGRS
jgi:hypothetical protein